MKKEKFEFKSFHKILSQYQKKIDSELGVFFSEEIKKSRSVFKQATETIEILRDIHLGNGKRIRPILVNVGYFLAGGNDKKSILRASLSIELIHNYFLIHDDIIDQDELRRGKPSLYAFYQKKMDNAHTGISLAIVAGDISAALGYQTLVNSKFLEKPKAKALDIFHQTVINTCHGQMLEMLLGNEWNKITEKDIFNILKNKTSYYTFANPIRIGAALAGADDKFLARLEKIALPLGIAFQIRDDILDLFGTEKGLGKPIASDIEENKPNLLILKTLTLSNPRDKKIFKKYLGKKNTNQKDIQEMRRIVKESGALDYCQDKAKRLVEGVKPLIQETKAPQKEKEFLLDLADYMVERTF